MEDNVEKILIALLGIGVFSCAYIGQDAYLANDSGAVVGKSQIQDRSLEEQDLDRMENYQVGLLKDIDSSDLDQEINQAFESLKKSDVSALNGVASSNSRRMKVYAKFELAKKFMDQKKYDFAVQQLKDIIHQESFSHLVVPSLHFLIQCSEKLGLTSEIKRYRSLLRRIVD